MEMILIIGTLSCLTTESTYEILCQFGVVSESLDIRSIDMVIIVSYTVLSHKENILKVLGRLSFGLINPFVRLKNNLPDVFLTGPSCTNF